MKPDINSIENSVDQHCFPNMCVHHMNMKYRMVWTTFFMLVPGQVNRNFQRFLNEMGLGWVFPQPCLLICSLLGPMEFSIKLHTIKSEWFIVSWGVTGYNFQKYCISFSEDQFWFSKQHRLMKCCIVRHFIWVFTVCQSTCLGVCSHQRVKHTVASPASLHCGPWARHIYPSLVLVQPRKTHPV